MPPGIGYATPGITDPLMSREPLGTEGELTDGPDDYVPYDDPEYWERIDKARSEPELPDFGGGPPSDVPVSDVDQGWPSIL